MEVNLIRVTEDPVMAIETAASKCYDSTPSEDGRIMDQCYKSGHLSVLEHVNFAFEVSGVSRALLNQLTRHRIASFSVRSQRYCKETDFDYVVPESIKKDVVALTIYKDTMKHISHVYESLLNNYNIPPEDARFLLPNACCTELIMTINLRSLINFMNERLCTNAQWEIRELANRMKNEIIKSYPKFTYMLVPKCEKHAPYCFCAEKKSCGKHKKIEEVCSNC